MKQVSISSQTKRRLHKFFLSFSLIFLFGLTSFVSFTYADTIEDFLASLATKNLGLQIEGNAAFEKDVYIGENVGIGTANPSEKLTVDGVIETSGGVKFADGSVLESGDFDKSSPTTNTGDIIINDGSGESHLPIGTEAQVLTVNEGIPSWKDQSNFDDLAPTNVVGDLIVHNGNGNNRLPVGGESQVLTVKNGVLSWEDAYAGDKLTSKARMYRHGNQLVYPRTFTKVTFNMTNFDTKGEFDQTQSYFKSVEGGVYQVNANLIWTTQAASSIAELYIYVNGHQYLRSSHVDEFGNISISDIVVLPPNGNVSIYVYHNENGVLHINGGSLSTAFSIAQIQ